MRTEQVNTALRKTISSERLGKYLANTSNDINKALDLYEENTRISEAFYTPLQCLEVCLRNSVHDQMSAVFGVDWLVNGKPTLLSASSAMINDAITALSSPSPGAIVAELKFAFWVGMLGTGYDATLWRQSLHKTFRATGGKKRTDVHGRLNAIRRFRNRVAHHEPIFDRNPKSMHDEIIEAISWMCRDTAKWAERHSRLPTLLK